MILVVSLDSVLDYENDHVKEAVADLNDSADRLLQAHRRQDRHPNKQTRT